MLSAHRHLTRPSQRIGVINKKSKFEKSIFMVFCLLKGLSSGE